MSGAPAPTPSWDLRGYCEAGAAEQQRRATDLLSLLRGRGYFVLQRPYIDRELVEQAVMATRRLFALPLEAKERCRVPDGLGQRGYTGFGIEQAIQGNTPDLKEYWHTGHEPTTATDGEDRGASNVWPEELPRLRDVYLELLAQADATGRALVEALSRALDVPAEQLREMTREGNSVLRSVHYPPLVELGSVPAGSIRAAAHRDINLFTFLLADTEPGLEFLAPDGRWVGVGAGVDSIVVDAGEMLALLTNDRIPATAHRVVNPVRDDRSRHSLLLFVHPHPEAELQCLDSCRDADTPAPEPVIAREFLLRRIEYWSTRATE